MSLGRDQRWFREPDRGPEDGSTDDPALAGLFDQCGGRLYAMAAAITLSGAKAESVVEAAFVELGRSWGHRVSDRVQAERWLCSRVLDGSVTAARSHRAKPLNGRQQGELRWKWDDVRGGDRLTPMQKRLMELVQAGVGVGVAARVVDQPLATCEQLVRSAMVVLRDEARGATVDSTPLVPI
jgi:DNA-directed RNA polymerase specialized sigma24 family protein